MIRVELPSGTVGITFHYNGPTVQDKKTKEYVIHPNETLANLIDYSDPSKPRPIARGRSLVHEPDIFSRAEGRRRSLRRALEVAGFGKKERTIIWLAYRCRGYKPPTPTVEQAVVVAA